MTQKSACISNEHTTTLSSVCKLVADALNFSCGELVSRGTCVNRDFGVKLT